MATYLAAGTELEEAKKQLVHRYELVTNQVRKETRDDLLASYLDAFANSLDPHSSYLSADDLENFRIALTLSLEGIGAELSSRDGYTTIERIVPGGAADRQGTLRTKDKIIAVGQETGTMVNVIDMRLREVVRKIRGRKGTRVRLAILRQGETTERFTVTIVRDKVDLEEQAASLRYETIRRGDRTLKLGVLELPSFYGDVDPNKRQANADMRRLLDQARRDGADGLVLDMAHNSGGILEQAVSIAGLFLRSGDIVAVRDSSADTDYLPDPDRSVSWAGPLVVLTSRLSASGAEIVAGALQDYRRAVIVGDSHTFGKGSVQTMMPLPPGLGALKTTVGLYYLPGGKSTQHSGVAADIVIPSLTDHDEIGESAQRFALPSQSITRFLKADAAAQRLTPATRTTIDTLRKRSSARVAVNKELAEQRERLAEMEENRGEVKLNDILAEQRDAEERADARRAEREERTLSPQLREALEVLADLVAQGETLVQR
jgi:carboxyl-terminal processing protease